MKPALAFALILCFSINVTSLSLAGVFHSQFDIKQLSGTVTTDGYPVSDAEITIKNVKTGDTNRATTNKNGKFVIYGVPVGLYEVTVKMEGYRSESRTAVVANGLGGGNVGFDLVPEGESALGVIQGTLKDKETGQNLKDAEVDIRESNTDRPHKVKTDDNGFYKKDGLIPGPYKITATLNGYREATKKAKLAKNEVKDVHFKLKKK